MNDIETALRSWRTLCDRCRVMGSLGVTFGAQATGMTTGSTILIFAHADVVDSSDGGRVVPIQTQDLISHQELVDARRLLQLARNLYAHEVTEQFQLDGKPVFDAHGEDRV